MSHDYDPSETLSVYGSLGVFCLSVDVWRRILTVAQWYGWTPQGTAAPDEYWAGEPSDWDGSYYPPVGQRVTEGDAKELASALERALDDIPDYDAVGDNVDIWSLDAPAVHVNPLQAFSGRKELFRRFILHCREEGGLWEGFLWLFTLSLAKSSSDLLKRIGDRSTGRRL